ncbi:MAG: type III secretion system chaperone [Desulfovibrio sp.]|nr:type III secretion system chaperone [Desulfovibrio sp.]
MDCGRLIVELGQALGIKLKFSKADTCGVFFDDDEVIFEQHNGQLYLIADLGSAAGREGVYKRLLTANYLGQESGQATLSLDADHEEFVLYRILDGDMGYPEFEKILTVFVRALRYWKEWLKQAQNVDVAALSTPPLGGIPA